MRGHGKRVSFREQRLSIFCVLAFLDEGPELPNFKIVVLDDTDNEVSKVRERLPDSSLVCRGRGSGAQMLQGVLLHCLELWEECWTACMDALDDVVRVEVSRRHGHFIQLH
jgi:hypothetical protein